MLIMDVDGVISSLKEKKAKPEVLQHIARELKNGKPVALNTGRSLDWVLEKTLPPLINDSKIKKHLTNLIVVGEKGGTWMTFDKNGQPEVHVDETISIPQNLQRDIKDLVESKYARSMFYDSPKKTMISTEMRDGYDMKDYEEDQKLLAPEVDELIKKYGLENILVVEPNPIAYDIQNKEVGKHLGVKRILDWLKDKKLNVSRFITIGDSPSDIKMAQELYKNNFSIIHVYVGEKKMEGKNPFKVVATSDKLEKGTLEFLQSL